MSGGHYNFIHSRLSTFVEELEDDLNLRMKEFFENLDAEAIREIQRIRVDAENLSVRLKALDYLVCGDTSQESFLKDVKEKNDTN